MNVFLLMVALTAPVEAPKAGLQEAAAANAAVAPVAVLPKVNAVSAAVSAAVPILPEARSDFDCNLCEVFRRRPLSGPWSITRRLNAASIRGDEDEVERLTALLENAVDEALEAEGAEP